MKRKILAGVLGLCLTSFLILPCFSVSDRNNPPSPAKHPDISAPQFDVEAYLWENYYDRKNRRNGDESCKLAGIAGSLTAHCTGSCSQYHGDCWPIRHVGPDGNGLDARRGPIGCTCTGTLVPGGHQT